MDKTISFYMARKLLLEQIKVTERETVALEQCTGRILGQDLAAAFDVPPFDRSPYDGYAFRAEDTIGASKEQPVTFRILEEIPAGGVSHCPVTAGCAVKILTGAPIPKGADAVIPYEKTEFTEETVTLFASVSSGSNIVKVGEDILAGEELAKSGSVIDPGLAGTLAAQNAKQVVVYRVPKIGIISTGSELVAVGEKLENGKIYNTNQYMLSTAVTRLGCEPVVLGMVDDSAEAISELIQKGLETCDMVLLTGGVSVGDYDLTPTAMEMAGIKILYRGVDLKPGMACACGVKNKKLVCGLSGNPASALTNYYAIVVPVIKKLCGYRDYEPEEFDVVLLDDFKKKSRATRLLRGSLELKNGVIGIRLPKEQGNVVLSSSIGCNVMAVVPAGSGPQAAGTVLKGFLLD